MAGVRLLDVVKLPASLPLRLASFLRGQPRVRLAPQPDPGTSRARVSAVSVAPAAPVTASRRWQTRATVFFFVLGAVPRVWAAVWDQNIYWPDEIFQTLEPAHQFAFHYGILPWEFREGARSWLFPGSSVSSGSCLRFWE